MSRELYFVTQINAQSRYPYKEKTMMNLRFARIFLSVVLLFAALGLGIAHAFAKSHTVTPQAVALPAGIPPICAGCLSETG